MANDQREVRLQKLERLKAEGVLPYAGRYPRTHTLEEARREAERAEGTKVRVAGRVMTSRAFGKLTFAHLQDASGRCQVWAARGSGPRSVRPVRPARGIVVGCATKSKRRP